MAVGWEKETAKIAAEKEMVKKCITGVLHAITSPFADTFEDSDNLIERIDTIYKLLDSNGSGGLDFGEFKIGIQSLPSTSSLSLSLSMFLYVSVSINL